MKTYLFIFKLSIWRYKFICLYYGYKVYFWVIKMTLREQIKVLSVRSGITMSELARRTGKTPQNFYGKLKRESFTLAELQQIAEAAGCSYEQYFLLENGEKI